MIAAAGGRKEGRMRSQVGSAELVEAGFADPQRLGGYVGFDEAGIEFREDPTNEIRRQAMSDLLLFKAGMSLGEETRASEKHAALGRGFCSA